MVASSALKTAINLHLMPMHIEMVKNDPLPLDVIELLYIAVGKDSSIRNAMQETNHSRKEIEQAASFFIENVLLSHDANSYRVLGSNSDATSEELRRNMALITRYLHPDLNVNGERSIFMTRLTEAWNNLKTPEKRAAYDRSLQEEIKKRKKKRKHRSSSRRKKYTRSPLLRKNKPMSKQPLSRKQRLRGMILRTLMLFLMKITGRT